jgi:hypothetical protein
MATVAQNLQTALDNFSAQLATISANPKPTYTVDGQTVSWTDHYIFLSQQITTLTQQLADASPFEYHSQGFVS